MTKILALDLATNTGWAFGPAGHVLRSGSTNMRKKDETREDVFRNIAKFIVGWCDPVFPEDKPDVIVCEAAMPPGAQSGGEATIIQWGLYANVCGIAGLCEVRVRTTHIQTVRKHYTGSSSHRVPSTFKPTLRDQKERQRQYNKLMTVERARQLGHIPIGCTDNDRADACGIHDFVSHAWYRAKPGSDFRLFS